MDLYGNLCVNMMKKKKNIPLLETINELIKIKSKGKKFGVLMNGQIIFYISGLIYKEGMKLMLQTQNWNKKYFNQFLLTKRKMVKKQRKVKNVRIEMRSNIEDVIKRSLDFSNPNSQIMRTRTQDEGFMTPVLKGDNFQSALKNASNHMFDQDFGNMQNIDYSGFNNQKAKVNDQYHSFIKQKLDQSAKLSMKERTLFIGIGNIEGNRTTDIKTKKRSKILTNSKTLATVDKKTRLTQLFSQSQDEQNISVDRSKSSNKHDSFIQTLLQQIPSLCNPSSNPFINRLKTMRTPNNNYLSNNIEQYPQNNQQIAQPESIDYNYFQTQIQTPYFQQLNTTSSIQSHILLQKFSQTLLSSFSNSSINLHHYFKTQSFNKSSKAILFSQLLNSRYLLKQTHPQQFSDIFVQPSPIV